jgi:hypothetical protein
VKGSINGWRPGKERGRLRALGAAVLAVVLMTVPAVAASAGPPERSEEPIFFIFIDDDHRLVAFANITRDDFCAWEADGFEGPPPAGPVSLQVKETGQGAIVASWKGEVPFELWQFDDDVSLLVDLCEDTDDQDRPWATGMGRYAGTDNDVDVSGTRTNSFGDRLRVTVVDVDGNVWHLSAGIRLLINKDDEFFVRALHFNLSRSGN